MRTTSAVAMLGAGLVAANVMTGCVPFGCGIADPTDVSSYDLAVIGSSTLPTAEGETPPAVMGMAAAPDGLWLLELSAGPGPVDYHYRLVEYDHPGGTVLHRFTLELGDVSGFGGLAWDGSSLWVGAHASTSSEAWKIDPTTGAMLTVVAMPIRTDDLTWNGSLLLVASGNGSFSGVDAATGKLEQAVPVNELSDVEEVTYQDGETWVTADQRGLLVYDATGTLIATATRVDSTSEASSIGERMAFVGNDLIVARGATLYQVQVTRPAVTL